MKIWCFSFGIWTFENDFEMSEAWFFDREDDIHPLSHSDVPTPEDQQQIVQAQYIKYVIKRTSMHSLFWRNKLMRQLCK